VKPILLQDVLIRIPAGFSTFQNQFIFALLEQTTKLLIPTGIVQHFHGIWDDFKNKQKFDYDQKIPKILSVNDLSFGFVIWLYACSVASVGFSFEWIYAINVHIFFKNMRRIEIVDTFYEFVTNLLQDGVSIYWILIKLIGYLLRRLFVAIYEKIRVRGHRDFI
jgi:hypothetical protein